MPGGSLASERSGRRECQAGAWGRADGANRESRQRPYGASHGEVRRRRCRAGASLRDGAVGGCQAGAWGRAKGANRESRQRPYGASHGGVGRRGCRAGASLRSGAVSAGARRGSGLEQTVQIVNPDRDPMERRTVASAEAAGGVAMGAMGRGWSFSARSAVPLAFWRRHGLGMRGAAPGASLRGEGAPTSPPPLVHFAAQGLNGSGRNPARRLLRGGVGWRATGGRHAGTLRAWGQSSCS